MLQVCRYARDMGRQQAAELRRGGVEMLCTPQAQPTSTVRRASVTQLHVSVMLGLDIHQSTHCVSWSALLMQASLVKSPC